MTVKVSKPAINVREELADLRKPSGTAGEAMLRAETPQEQFNLIGAGRRNLLINGAMQVSQRGTSFSGIYGTTFVVDRFKFSSSSNGTWTLSQDTDAPAGFSKSLKMLCTTADSSVGSSDYSFFLYKLEGNEVQQLASGTSSAKSVTVSFWVKSNVTGTYSLNLRNEDNARQCGSAYTVDSADTWEYKTATIPADTVAGYNDDNSLSLQIEWWLGSGSAFSNGTIPTNWEASSNGDRGAANTVNIATVSNGYLQITGVQLEVGKVATPFEYRSYGEELAACQRYFQLDFRVSHYLDGNNSTKYIGFNFPPMRAAPSATRTSNSVSGSEAGTTIVFNSNKDGYVVNGASYGVGGIYNLDAEL